MLARLPLEGGGVAPRAALFDAGGVALRAGILFDHTRRAPPLGAGSGRTLHREAAPKLCSAAVTVKNAISIPLIGSE